MHRVLITGDRNWCSYYPVRVAMNGLKKKHGTNLIVIGGGASGADLICKRVCAELSIHYAEVKALWETRHKSAGPQRNKAMLGLEPHEVIAFHKDLSQSTGTKDMVERALRAGLPVRQIKK